MVLPLKVNAFFNEMQRSYTLDGSTTAARGLPGTVVNKLMHPTLQSRRSWPGDG